MEELIIKYEAYIAAEEKEYQLYLLYYNDKNLLRCEVAINCYKEILYDLKKYTHGTRAR